MINRGYERDLQRHLLTKETWVRMLHELSHYVLLNEHLNNAPESLREIADAVTSDLEWISPEDLFVEEIKAIAIQIRADHETMIHDPNIELDLARVFDVSEQDVSVAIGEYMNHPHVVEGAAALEAWMRSVLDA